MKKHALKNYNMHKRFRGFLPIVVDIETGGVDPEKNAILEIAATSIILNEKQQFVSDKTFHYHVTPHPNTTVEAESIKIHGIDVSHPFRFAISEQQMLTQLSQQLKQLQKQQNCTRCVMVAHNAWFDLLFFKAACKRNQIKQNPFHSFTCFDTASLAAFVYGHSVLSTACKIANIAFDSKQAHGALYDCNKTAALFCHMLNQWQPHFKWPILS